MRISSSNQLEYEKMKKTVADKSFESKSCFVSSSEASSCDMNISSSPAVSSAFDSFLLQSAIDCGVTAHGCDAMTPSPFSLNTSSIAIEDSFGSDEPPRTDHVKELLARLNAEFADDSYESKAANSRPFQLSQAITSPTNRMCLDDIVWTKPNMKPSKGDDTPKITNHQSTKGPNFSVVVSPVSKQEQTEHSLSVGGEWSFDEKQKISDFDLDFKDSSQWVTFEPFEEFIHPTQQDASAHNEVSLELKDINARLASIELLLRNVIHIDDGTNFSRTSLLDDRTCTPVKEVNQSRSVFGRFLQKKSNLCEV